MIELTIEDERIQGKGFPDRKFAREKTIMVKFLNFEFVKIAMILLVIGLVTAWGAVSTASADLIIDTPQEHIVSGGVTPVNQLNYVYLVANYVVNTPIPGDYVQMAYLIGDTVPGGQETTFEFTIPDMVDYTATRYYTVMGVTSAYDDVNLGFTPTVAADLITNSTSWSTYFHESFQPGEISVAYFLDIGNTVALGGFLNANSGISPHKMGVGLSGAYGGTIQYEIVDFCEATDGGDTWVREGRIPEPVTLLLLAPGMFLVARRRRQT